MTKFKAVVCTALLLIVILGGMIGAMFVHSTLMDMNLAWFIGGTIGYWQIGRWTICFYQWLLKDDSTKDNKTK